MSGRRPEIILAPENEPDPLDDFSLWEPPAPAWSHANDDDRRRARHLPSGNWAENGTRRGHRLEFNTEEAYGRYEEWHASLTKVRCPSCGRTCAPLLSSRTRYLGSGWRWVGLEYREPYQEWLCVCPGCRIDYVLTIFSPQ